MDIYLLRCVQSNKRIGTHDVVCDTFIGFHVGRKQLHVFSLNTFNSSCRRVDIVLTKNGIRTLVNVVIANMNGLICLIFAPPKNLLFSMWLKPNNRAIMIDTLLINSSP
jgi:hypothetical protein